MSWDDETTSHSSIGWNSMEDIPEKITHQLAHIVNADINTAKQTLEKLISKKADIFKTHQDFVPISHKLESELKQMDMFINAAGRNTKSNHWIMISN